MRSKQDSLPLSRITRENLVGSSLCSYTKLIALIIRERVRSGMANAKAKGAKIGRPHKTKDDIPAVFYRHYPAYKSGALNVSELARVCGLSRTTVYKYLEMVG